jgi:arylamine N-acetyltransferase
VPSHRLLRLLIDGQTFFADVGNGWPSLRLFPADRDASFACFGIRFNSAVGIDRLRIQQERGGRVVPSVEIPIAPQDQQDVRRTLARRFDQTYPFSWRLRFAQVVNDEFLFLRDRELSIYSSKSRVDTRSFDWDKLPEVIGRVFSFDVAGFLEATQLRVLIPRAVSSGGTA